METIFAGIAEARADKGVTRTVVEHSPRKASQSNGVVERGVQAVQDMVRTMRSALEEQCGREVGRRPPSLGLDGRVRRMDSDQIRGGP